MLRGGFPFCQKNPSNLRKQLNLFSLLFLKDRYFTVTLFGANASLWNYLLLHDELPLTFSSLIIGLCLWRKWEWGRWGGAEEGEKQGTGTVQREARTGSAGPRHGA